VAQVSPLLRDLGIGILSIIPHPFVIGGKFSSKFDSSAERLSLRNPKKHGECPAHSRSARMCGSVPSSPPAAAELIAMGGPGAGTAWNHPTVGSPLHLLVSGQPS